MSSIGGKSANGLLQVHVSRVAQSGQITNVADLIAHLHDGRFASLGKFLFVLDKGILELTKIYVGNLAYATTSSDLDTMFSEFGGVSDATVITDRDTGRSKGFGFVEMSNDSEAQKAIQALHEKNLDGRQIKVNEARPREERSRRW